MIDRLVPYYKYRLRCSQILTTVIVSFLLISVFNIPSTQAQVSDSSSERAQALLDTLTPEERVGQLILVTFTGTNVDSESQIFDLIVNHHISGVILQAENDNFLSSPQTTTGTWQLTRSLQSVEWSASQSNQIDLSTNQEFTPAFIPLFVGISQEGNGPPYDQIFNGLTKLPSLMAIGATWQPEIARQVGSVAGTELNSLGINLLLGPSLDALESPREIGSGDLGVRTFGGDPFWVGEFGQEYISGVHEGSAGRIAVIAKHFPGHGSSDRLPEEEVATVRKSLEQLKQIELPPFYAVTGNGTDELATSDGLLASHIRYQGFQGNIRETTRPVSLDRQAFDQLMSLPQFAAWNEAGGVMVTDNLGSPAFRRFADPTGQNFQARFLARDAFLAGNDLLFLGNQFIATTDTDQYTSIIRTLEFFAQKYRDDAAFKEQVDRSVLQILALKFRLFDDNFTLSQILPNQDGLDLLENSSQVIFQVAQQSATLISPTLTDLAETLPEPPTINDRILFFSDVSEAQQCTNCAVQEIFPVTALEDAVMRLYGPLSGGQVLQRNLNSYSFDELLALLDRIPDTDVADLDSDIQQAQWLVFSLLSVRSDDPSSQALSRFLAERPDLFRQKNLVVFAFDAPYYLDATEISKLSAYYGLYSRIPQFVETAARLLFGEFPAPPGELPVSVTGVDYDLISATAPDPEQTIDLGFDLPGQDPGTAIPRETPQFEIGDLVPIKTGIITDHNGHQVPDGTPVQFIMNLGLTEISSQTEVTTGGIARATFLIEESGSYGIRARSDPAVTSSVIQIDIAPEAVIATENTPVVEPTETPTEQPEPSPTPLPEATSTPSPPGNTTFSDWLLASVITIGLAISIYWLTTSLGLLRWGIRAALLATIGGLLGYCYLALDLPGSQEFLTLSGTWGVVVVTVMGVGLGWVVSIGWQKYQNNMKEKVSAH
jgi:beta-N-acetylhexosaminidase